MSPVDKDGYLVPHEPPAGCPYPGRWVPVYEEFQGVVRHMSWRCEEGSMEESDEKLPQIRGIPEFDKFLEPERVKVIKDPDNPERRYAVPPETKIHRKIRIVELMVLTTIEKVWEEFGAYPEPVVEVLAGDHVYMVLIADTPATMRMERNDTTGGWIWLTDIGGVTITRTRELKPDQIELRVRF